MLKVFHHWLLPIGTAFFWWAMLIALLICWSVQGFPIYPAVRGDKDILYISDVAATNLQGIFIAGAATQGLCFVLGLASERLLRHHGRLPRNLRRREKISSGLAIGFATIGSLGILFVSIFNTVSFSSVHESMLIVFIVFIGLSSLSSIYEYFYLDKNYPDYASLAWSVRLKVVWFIIELGLAIAFGASQNRHVNASAVIEWTLSFIYPFYALIVAYDLYPAHSKAKGFYNQSYPAGPTLSAGKEESYQTSDDMAYPQYAQEIQQPPLPGSGVENSTGTASAGYTSTANPYEQAIHQPVPEPVNDKYAHRR